jgi:tetratricopeptide (TPR) repeat protein
MERIISDKDIPYGSPIYEKGKRQFEANLRAIVSKAARAGVPVVLSDLVCNVRDQKPFSSIETDSAGSANRAFRAARALESRKRYKEAHAEYLRAKDLDAIRFRASEEFDAVILRTAEAFNAPVVPMKKLFENAAPNGLVGDALMTDHLHPNVNGYFLMADGFFQTLRNNAFIAATWDSTRIRPVAALRRDWGFTELDSMVADLGIRFLKGGWPFQPKTAVNTALSDFRPFTAAESLAVVIAGSTGDSETLEIGHVRLARRYMAEGRWESAFREYRALYTAIPYETMFYQGAVEALFKKGDRARALECLRLSRRFLDTNFANRWIGLIYLEQGNPSEAIPYLERARARVGSDTQVLQALQKAYAETGEPSKSEAAAGALRSMPPPDRAVPRRTAEDATPPADPVRIALERAQRLVQAGELERALALIEGTLSVRETFQARNWIGQIYLQQKRYSQAIPQLERARALNPEDPGVLYNLSLVYLLTGNTGRSSEILGELEAAAPGFQGIERIRSEIHRRTGS